MRDLILFGDGSLRTASLDAALGDLDGFRRSAEHGQVQVGEGERLVLLIDESAESVPPVLYDEDGQLEAIRTLFGEVRNPMLVCFRSVEAVVPVVGRLVDTFPIAIDTTQFHPIIPGARWKAILACCPEWDLLARLPFR